MALDQQLLEILACPDTHHAPLEHDPGAQTLTCTECGRVFEIRDDIPILLLDEARLPGAGTPASPPADGPVEKPAADGVAQVGQKGSGEPAPGAAEAAPGAAEPAPGAAEAAPGATEKRKN